MSTSVRILALAGSLRKASFNKHMVAIAAAAAAASGATVQKVDLRDFPLPVFDEDLEKEQGTPEAAKKLKELFVSSDGLLIASPEYNSSVTAALKNAIDWVSRSAPGEAPLAAFSGKAAAIMSASPGGLGGIRGLVHLRSILGNVGVLVLPDQVMISAAHEAFGADGTLKDNRQREKVEKLGKGLAELLQKIRR